MANEINRILKNSGFDLSENDKKKNVIVLQIESGNTYLFNASTLCKISNAISDVACRGDGIMKLDKLIDAKFMNFLTDYAKYVEKNDLPVFDPNYIMNCTTLESAIGKELYEIVCRNFDFKYMRADEAYLTYLESFCRYMKCSLILISENLMQFFAIIIATAIIRHLPEKEYSIL